MYTDDNFIKTKVAIELIRISDGKWTGKYRFLQYFFYDFKMWVCICYLCEQFIIA